MKRAEVAKDLFNKGYACCQAIALAFNDLTNIKYEDMEKMTLGLGGGVSRLRLTCGVVTGMAIIISSIFSNCENSQENKEYVYSLMQELGDRFLKQEGSYNCKELLEKAKLEVEIGGKPEERTNEYYQKRPCGKLVYNAAIILEEYLTEKGIKC